MRRAAWRAAITHAVALELASDTCQVETSARVLELALLWVLGVDEFVLGATSAGTSADTHWHRSGWR